MTCLGMGQKKIGGASCRNSKTCALKGRDAQKRLITEKCAPSFSHIAWKIPIFAIERYGQGQKPKTTATHYLYNKH